MKKGGREAALFHAIHSRNPRRLEADAGLNGEF
jgi:hypothetical protein